MALCWALLVLVTCLAVGNLKASPGPEKGRPILELVFKYGVAAKNRLDTHASTFTRDMVADPPITIPMKLTDADLNRIRAKMDGIRFFDYPSVFKIEVPHGQSQGFVTPFQTYHLEVTTERGTKVVDWEDEIIVRPPDGKAEKLRELFSLIKQIVFSKPEYKRLPAPRAGYL